MIFGIGLSKTGTTSLFVALHLLGYRAGTFRHLMRLGLADWFKGSFERDYLAEYDALTDLPIGLYYPELDKRYPNSKFILTTRSLEPWIKSISAQFVKHPDPAPGFIRDVRLATYGATSCSDVRYRHVYETHSRDAIAYFRDRPGTLLQIDILAGDGWKDVCPFLGQPIPTQAFPHVQPGYRLALESTSPYHGGDARSGASGDRSLGG